MRRWPLLLLLSSGLTFLASLYLPWQVASRSTPLFGSSIEGWGEYGYDFGFAAAVFALGLVAAAGGAIARPALISRLPLAGCGVLVAYGAVAVAVDTWYARGYARRALDAPVRYHLGYGAYLGIAARAAALLGAVSLRRRPPLTAAPAVALWIALALPWARFAPLHVSFPAYAVDAAAVAIVAALWLPAAALLFCGGVAVALAVGTDLVYGAWIGLGLGALLAALSAREVVGARHADPIVVLASAAFVATLYFHWQGAFVGWTLLGTTAAVLAVTLVVATAVRLRVSALEVAVAFALIVATQGFESTAFTPRGYGVRIAAKLGFAFAAALVGIVLLRSRALRPPRDRIALRAVAAGAAVAYVVVSLAPTWHVLPGGWVSTLLFVPRSWLGVAAVLLAIRLAGAWLRPTVEADWVCVLPLALLSLIALELVRRREYELNWGAGLLVAVSLLLAALGWLERRGRLDRFRVPEILRVDRV